MQGEFVVIGITHQVGSWPVMCEFPGCLGFRISERWWIQTVTEFQLEAPYLSGRANYQLLGRPCRISVRFVALTEEGLFELECQMVI